MKPKSKNHPDVKRIVYTVAPEYSAISIVLAGTPEGYTLWKMERKGERVVVHYTRNDVVPTKKEGDQ